jgi:hypothetical protein
MSLTLAQVDAAIAKVLKGQSYTSNGYTYTRADLNALRSLRSQLQAETGVDGTGRKVFARGRLNR